MLQETFLHVVDGKVYVICPKCRKGMYRKVKNKMKSRGMVFCPGCKSKFVAQLDFRQQYRKIT